MCVLCTPTVICSCMMQKGSIVIFHILMSHIALTEIYFCFALSIWKVEAVEDIFCEYFCSIFFSCISWLYATSNQQFIFFPCNATHCAGINMFCISLSVKSWNFMTIRMVSKSRLKEQNSTRTDIIHQFWDTFFWRCDISPLRMTWHWQWYRTKHSDTHFTQLIDSIYSWPSVPMVPWFEGSQWVMTKWGAPCYYVLCLS